MISLENIGINKGKISQFNKKGIYSCEDLVKFLPRKYYDFTKVKLIRDAKDGEQQAFIGVLSNISKKDDKHMLKAILSDGSGKRLYITWFHKNYLIKDLYEGDKYFFAGKAEIKDFNNGQLITMTNPISFSRDIEESKKVYPIYSRVHSKMSDEFLLKSINSALALVDKNDYLEGELLHKYSLIPTNKMLRAIHQPSSMDEVEKAKERLLFDDLFLFNYQLKYNSRNNNTSSNYVMKKYDLSKKFMDNLPFDLTDGQRKVLRELSLKMYNGQRINSLVQGDVGSGKTMVAILLMVVAKDNGYQSVLMCPTEVLAKQHFKEITEGLEPLGIKVGFLSGDLKPNSRAKKSILKEIKDGSLDIIVGTHAVISKDVEYNNLAMVVVDEEHRFGVVQRETLKEKGDFGVHTVNMSATPIPRSLALSLYGEGIEVMTITTMPKGRQPIETKVIDNIKYGYDKMFEEIKKGRQCYVVCPLIEDNEKLKDINGVETTFKNLQNYYKNKNIKIGMINGKMKSKEVDEEILKFYNKEYDIIVSTTIIEVGVNVPNSTVILISNAERFGLSQLHQLRGRVGRGSYKSYCILYTNKKDSMDKLYIMEKTTSGFEIATQDLVLRGTGEFLGTQQSGKNKYVMLMLANPKLNDDIRKEIDDILKSNSRALRYKELLNIDISEK